MNASTLRKKLPLLGLVLVCVAITSTGYFNQRDVLKKTTSAASEQVEATAEQIKAAAFDPSVLEPAAEDLVIGSSDAPITIIDYSSLTCPHCAAFHKDVLPQLQKTYLDTGKAKLVFRHFPLNEPALRAAQLVQCAPEVQRLNFIGVLFDMQDQWAFAPSFLKDIKQIAAVGGVSGASFDTCMANQVVEAAILQTRKDAAERAMVDSTPSFFINGTPLKAVPTLQAFDEAIAAAQTALTAPVMAEDPAK